MASVDLVHIHFNVAEDPSDHLALRSMSGFSRRPHKRGRVDPMAGGRTRLIKRAGVSQSWNLGFRFVTPEQKEWLEDHMGVLMCARDDRGHKIFGAYLEPDIPEWLWSKDGEVSLVFTEITHSEAV